MLVGIAGFQKQMTHELGLWIQLRHQTSLLIC